MPRVLSRVLAAVAAIIVELALCGSTAAEDWPQFLGPRRDGTSSEIVKPWTGNLKVAWRAKVGDGHSSPVVAGGRVFLLDKVPGKDVERLTAFDAKTGMQLASTEYPRAKFESQFGVGPRATPTVSGDQVVTLGVTGRLGFFALSSPNGSLQLQNQAHVDILEQFKVNNLKFGLSASPLIEEDFAIVQAGGELHDGPKGKGAGVLAFDRNSGKLAWQATDHPASYSSPIAIGEGKNRQVVVLTEKGLVGLSPKDSRVFWEYPFQDPINESSTSPLLVGDLLIASSVMRGSVALKLTEKNGQPGVTEVWKKPELNCYFSTPVAVGKDYLYMVNGLLSRNPSIMLRCVETATGKTLWSKSKIGKYHAAIIKTGDEKLLMLDDAGRLTLIQPNPKEYQQLAQSKVCGETWAHPALSNGRLYLRDAKELICLELEK